MPNNSGTLIIAPIRPQSAADTFPSAYASELLGGHYQVADIAARDALPDERLLSGMFCTTQDTNTVFILTSTGPNVWEEFTSGSGDSDQLFSGTVDLDTVNNVYSVGHPAISGSPLPMATLISPDTDSVLYVSALSNVTDTGFDIVLSGVPDVSGYQVNWTNGLISSVNLSGGGVFVHDELLGLGDDDHPQYILVDGSREITGSLIPSTSGTLDLGSLAQPFRELYVTENSIYMGSSQLSIIGGELAVDGTLVTDGVDSEISDLASDIAVVSGGVDTNTAAIGVNASDITTLDSDLSADIAVVSGGVDANASAISAVQGDYVDLSSIQTVGGAKTFSDDLIINANLYVNGTEFIVDTTSVSATDNTITINAGEVGAGVTAGVAGIVVDRGSLTDYQFVFTEASDTFKIGEIGSEQAVATREDAPIDGGVAVWDNATNKLITSLDYVSLTASETISGAKTFASVVIGVTPSLASHLATKGYIDTRLIDHGGLDGLGDDDHTQYLRHDGGRQISGTLIPDTSGAYDLGSLARPFQEIYASDTLYIGPDTLSTSAGTLLVNGSPVGAGGASSHGALTDLEVDDHTQYLLADGSRDISGNFTPSTSGTLDLGSVARPFQDAYITDTLYIKSNTITVSGGILLVNGTEVQGGGGSADTAVYTAGENISGGDLCYQETDGFFYKVDSTDEAKSTGFLAFATENIISSSTGTFQTKGTFTDGTLTPSAIYYASTDGDITATPDVDTDGVVVRVVGYGLPNGDLDISPDQTWVVVGFGNEVEVYTAGENISGGDLCYQHTDGTFYKVDASDPVKSTGFLAIALDNIDSAATGNFRISGIHTDGTLTVGAIYYASSTTAGAITDTPDTTTEDYIVRVVGYGLPNGDLILSVDETWVTVGPSVVGRYVQAFSDGDLTAGVLTVNHALSNQHSSVTITNNNDKSVNPDDITFTDDNNLDVDLTSSGTLIGSWTVLVLAQGGGGAGTNVSDGGSNISALALDAFPTSIIPDTSGAYDLGSAALPFRDLYVNENSIHMGSTVLSVSDGVLQVDSADVNNNTPMYMRSYLSSVQSSTGIIVFDTEVEDSENAYNNSTGIYTIPTGGAGLWSIISQARINLSGSSTPTLSIKKDSSTLMSVVRRAMVGSTLDTMLVTDTLRLADGDTIEIDFNTTNLTQIEANPWDTYFTMTRIGS